MILPTKRMSNRALLLVGARILDVLQEPATVSRVWTSLRADDSELNAQSGLTYDWFVLALDLLFLLGAIEYEDGRLVRAA